MLIKSTLAFLLLFMNLHITAPSSKVDSGYAIGSDCSISNNTFTDGEVLVYKAYFNWGFIWLNAAEITFRVEDTPKGYYISAVGDTYSSYEWLYNVYDKYEVLLDKNTLLPIWSTKNVKENSYTQYEKMVFDHQNRKVVCSKGPNEKNITTKIISIDDCAHDLLSVIYFVRNYDFRKFTKGKNIPLNVFLDQKLYKLGARYDGMFNKKEIKEIGSYNTIRLSPETIEGTVFSSNKGSYLYASNDNNQVPLLIETKLKVGSIKIVLKSAKNLRFPLTARVK